MRSLCRRKRIPSETKRKVWRVMLMVHWAMLMVWRGKLILRRALRKVWQNLRMGREICFKPGRPCAKFLAA